MHRLLMKWLYDKKIRSRSDIESVQARRFSGILRPVLSLTGPFSLSPRYHVAPKIIHNLVINSCNMIDVTLKEIS